MREFFRENAAYWIREFHLGGLRLDATQDIHDECKPHIIGEAARRAAGSRSILLIGENETQDTNLIKPVTDGGYGLDVLWNDDLHHSRHGCADRQGGGVLFRLFEGQCRSSFRP